MTTEGQHESTATENPSLPNGPTPLIELHPGIYFFLMACKSTGAGFYRTGVREKDGSFNYKGCPVPKWQLKATQQTKDALTVEQALQCAATGTPYCIIWPKDLPRRVCVLDRDDYLSHQFTSTLDLPHTVRVKTGRKIGEHLDGDHLYFLLPDDIEIANVISEGAMEKAEHGRTGVFVRGKVIVGPGSVINGRRYELVDEESDEPGDFEFAELPREFAYSLAQMKSPSAKDEADLLPECPATDDDIHDVRVMLKMAAEQKKKFIDGKDDIKFLRAGTALKWALGEDSALKVLATQPGNKTYNEKRIGSLITHTRQLGNLIDLMQKSGVKIDFTRLKTKNPNDTASTHSPLVADTGVIHPGEEERQKIMKHITASGDSVCVSGRPGQGKTTHVLEWMRIVEEIGYTNAFVNIDMPNWQAKTRFGKAGLKLTELIYFGFKGRRHLPIEELITAIDERLKKEREPDKKRKLGILCFDNANKIFRAMWQSVAETIFDSNSDECAGLAHDKIINRLAEHFKCCVVFIGHPGKGAGSKDKYPGSEQWAAEAGIAYRIYRLNNTNLEETPKSIVGLYKRYKKGHNDTLAQVFKTRYDTKPYWQTFDEKTKMPQNEAVGEELVLESVTPEINEDDYIKSLKSYLADHPNKEIGFKELKRAKQIPPAMTYTLWAGIVVTKLPRKSISNGEGVCHSTKPVGKGKPLVTFIKA